MNLHSLILWLATLVVPVYAATPASIPPQTGIAGAFAFETSEFMKATAYKGGSGMGSSMSPAGAFGTNIAWDATKSGQWFIEEQRFAADAVGAGLAYGDPQLIERGFKMMEWGFAKMQPDGSFKCEDNYHSASFFIEAAAYSLLLIENSPQRDAWQLRIDALKPKLLMAAKWMTKPNVQAAAWAGPQEWKTERPYAHRRFLDAAAIGETGALLHDAELISKSKALIHDGIRIQQSNGVNPEKGGYDSHYQALGLVFATRYYALVADGVLQGELKRTVDKAFAWLATRIAPDGTVNTTGNTRTGGQETTRSGKVKGIDYKYVYRSFGYWAVVTGEPVFQDYAKNVAAAEAGIKK